MLQYDLLIRNGTVVTPHETFATDIAVLDGKIAAFLAPGGEHRSKETIDAAGRYVLPGLIDAHVHFRDPGLTDKEDFASGTLAAAFGGITTVLDMPNVLPVTSSAGALKSKLDGISSKAYIDYGLFSVLTGDNLCEMEGLKEAGATGYKIYIGTSVGNIAAPADGMIYDMLSLAARNGMRTGFHAENNAVNDYFTQRLRREGKSDAGYLPQARPSLSEALAVSAALCYSEATGAKIHIYHVSSKEAVALIRDAKRRGIPVTAETCPHYLLFTDEDYGRLGARLKIFPPVRGDCDREALWEGIHDGTIDMLATDHAPHTDKEKAGDLFSALAGVTGVETMPRLLLDQVNRGRLTLQDFVRLLSEAPAKIWGLYPGKGTLQIGTDADITIVDLEREAPILSEQLHSRWKSSVFEGLVTKGLATAAIVRGRVIVNECELRSEPGYGKFTAPGETEGNR